MSHWAHGLIVFSVAALMAQSPMTGGMRVVFTEAGETPASAVTGVLYFDSPGVGSRQQSIALFKDGLDVGSMPEGSYRVTVVAQTSTHVLVSSRVHEVQVVAGKITSLSVDLIRRRGTAVVVDASGAPVPGAHFYTSPSSVNSTADEDGRINLATIATGTTLTIRTIQWGMTCHRVTSAAQQTVVVPDATEALVIVAPTTPTSTLPQRRHILPSLRLAGALISGIPGSDCAVPYEHFPVTMAKVNGWTEHTMLLPFGRYTIRLFDGATLTADAPGRIEIR